MIKFDIQEYCQECMDFHPDVERPVKMHNGDDVIQTDTIVRCENRGRCAAIKRYLDKQQKESAQNAENH